VFFAAPHNKISLAACRKLPENRSLLTGLTELNLDDSYGLLRKSAKETVLSPSCRTSSTRPRKPGLYSISALPLLKIPSARTYIEIIACKVKGARRINIHFRIFIDCPVPCGRMHQGLS
jgi:hypothetical protein